ncbi:MAG: carboxypeptidase regulatory-like domain-containing protein, partial [Blastocatellia bacterium]|nr:carboxypeptidase regulatory-like domain-containing protein [Blastocatellia bacterium]
MKNPGREFRQLIVALTLLLGSSLIPTIVFTQSQVGSISGTVKDQNGAVVPNAAISIRSESSGQVQSASTDGRGRFKVERLEPGSYRLSVTHAGFKTAERSLAVEGGKQVTIEIRLEIAETHAEVTVGAKGSLTPNTDPNYRALRDDEPEETYEVSELSLKRDVGMITFHSGHISFLPPVLGKVAIGVFTGDGEFTLTPAIVIEKNYLKLLTEQESVSEQFDRLVLVFTDHTYEELKKDKRSGSADPRAKEVLREFHNRMRRNTEEPRGFVEALFSGENVENLEAVLLGCLYNPKRQPMFNAYIFGRKNNDLRFQVRPYGAFPQMMSPEEVALINNEPQG